MEIKPEQKDYISPTDAERLKSYLSVDVHVQADLILYEILSRLTAIGEMHEKKADNIDIQIFSLKEYIRGLIDGNRFGKKPGEISGIDIRKD